MAYCTLADIEAAITETSVIQLTDDDRLGAPDTDIVADAIARADAEIDGYCAARYALPLSPVPDLIRSIAVDIAAYNLYSRRMEEVPPTRESRYDSAVKKLVDIARGLVSISSSGALMETTDAGEVIYAASDRTFTSTTLSGY